RPEREQEDVAHEAAGEHEAPPAGPPRGPRARAVALPEEDRAVGGLRDEADDEERAVAPPLLEVLRRDGQVQQPRDRAEASGDEDEAPRRRVPEGVHARATGAGGICLFSPLRLALRPGPAQGLAPVAPEDALRLQVQLDA